MSKDKYNVPRADALMGTMRSMGYSFESAIADVIDNSISANCSFVKVFFPKEVTDKIAVGILDDGEGMPDDILFEAMRYGSGNAETERNENDLGRFGLGMKSASLSQCRVLSVASKFNGRISCYSWDFNYIEKTKDWIVKELSPEEIASKPYIDNLNELDNGTLVIWEDFDVLSKSSDGLVFDSLKELEVSVDYNISLIFHRYISSSTKNHLCIFINNHKVKALDPFLESHPKTTTKKIRTIALKDSNGIERQISIKPFILPFATDLSVSDKKNIGGIENLRAKQGFYIYRNKRLIIWGTWFNMKPRSELTKNARIRVDIPNTLDDIWNIDIKKQTATIPKRIQQQLKNTVAEAMNISTKQQTHRGRKENAKDIDYIWNRMRGRNNTFYYQINRDNKVFQMIREKMSDEDYVYLDMLITEIEQNLPIQQIYIDRSTQSIDETEIDTRIDDVFQLGVTMVESIKKINTEKTIPEIISDIMKTEPFCHYANLKEKLLSNYTDETKK
jgi:hypothetical protein